MSDQWFDLYLFLVGEANVLYKLSHLSKEDADKYADYWIEMNDMHDYMLVLEGSTPWDDTPTIIEKSPEWISLEYARLQIGV